MSPKTHTCGAHALALAGTLCTQASTPLSPLPAACRATWEDQASAPENYARLGFVSDSNAGYGRNRKPDVLVEKVERDPALLEAEPDDGEQRSQPLSRRLQRALP